MVLIRVMVRQQETSKLDKMSMQSVQDILLGHQDVTCYIQMKAQILLVILGGDFGIIYVSIVELDSVGRMQQMVSLTLKMCC